MPELTPKLGIKKPLGNETVSRAAFNENWDIIDQKAVGDLGGAPSIQAGSDTSKPAAGTAGRLYVATDTQIIYRDTGAAWAKVGVVKWGDIEGKPSTFPPSSHTHTRAQVTDFAHRATHFLGGSDQLTAGDIGAVANGGNTPSISANAEVNRPTAGVAGRLFIATDTQRIYRDTGTAWVLVGVVNWADVANKPTTFPPSPHKTTHATGGADALAPADIGAAPSAHSHGLITSDGKAGILSNMALYTISSGVINAGTLPIAAGGTGGTTAATARANLEAAAQSDLAAHLAETVLKTNKTINVPADYSTIQAALDSLKYTWIPSDVTVTISVAASTYSYTSPVYITHPCGSQIQIIGSTPISTTISSVGTISGSAGAWSVPITVVSVSGMQVGQYAIIRNTTGTGDHYAFRGIWEITAINGNTVTVKNTHRKSTFPTATLTGGDFIVTPTILKFNDCDGIKVFDKSLGLLDKVAIVGNNSASTTSGIISGYPIRDYLYGGNINCGDYVGVNGFTYGFLIFNGSCIIGDYLSASGNSQSGFVAQDNGSINASFSVANGNGQSGFWASQTGSIYALSSTASGNGDYGFLVQYSGSIYAPSSTASGNGNYGFLAQYSGSISAPSSTASGNATDYQANKMGYIYCAGYTGTPTFSPAVNTEGNYNAIITT